MAQEDFKIPGLKLFGKEVDNINGEKEETREQIWRDSHMLFKFEKGSGEDELPTDIDIDTIFLDYFSHENSSSSNQEEPLSRELVLVLPGIGMDLEVNKPFLQALAKTGRRVISLSVPGCGDSGDPSKEWRRDGGDKKNWKGDFSNYSTLLNRIIKELKAQGKIEEGEKFRVIGHSLGGVMGAEFTANNLDKVKEAIKTILEEHNKIKKGDIKKEEIYSRKKRDERTNNHWKKNRKPEQHQNIQAMPKKILL